MFKQMSKLPFRMDQIFLFNRKNYFKLNVKSFFEIKNICAIVEIGTLSKFVPFNVKFT